MNKKRMMIIALLLLAFFLVYSGAIAPSGYKIGDTGPGGGEIFYVSKEGFTVYMLNPEENYTAHYLEIAPPPQKGCTWAIRRGPGDRRERTQNTGNDYDVIDVPGTGTEIGTGRRNTELILQAERNTAPVPTEIELSSIAAGFCRNAVCGGKTDWFLPSKDELDEFYKYKGCEVDKEYERLYPSGINPSKSFNDSYYWSSSEYTSPLPGETYAWIQYMPSGYQWYDVKAYVGDYTYAARPIRAF